MGAPQYEQAGADIGGTGTTDTIPRWTGASTLGDSIITQTGSTRITVGSGAYAGASVDGFRVANGTNSYIAASDGTRTLLMGANGAQVLIGSLTNHSLVVKTNNIDAMTILPGAAGVGGNVGIGTASPGYRLDVNVTPGSASGAVLSNGGSGNDIARWTVNTTTGEILFGQARAAAGSYFLTFYTAGSERARIDSNGNIYGTSGTTGMTNGFFYIPAAAGAPTGTPTAVSGRVPMYYDTTNNEFYVYNGAWKKVTLA